MPPLQVNGNVNPAAEANIFGDPDAANVVFSKCALGWHKQKQTNKRGGSNPKLRLWRWRARRRRLSAPKGPPGGAEG